MKELVTENTKKLDELIAQLNEHDTGLFKLETQLSSAQRKLTELENDTAADIDESAREAVKLSATITECNFKVTAMQNRRSAIATMITQTADEVVRDYKANRRTMENERSAAVKKLIESKEVKKAAQILRAAYELQGRKYWTTILADADINDSEPGRESTERAASELGIDTDYYLATPDCLVEARNLTGHDFDLNGNIN